MTLFPTANDLVAQLPLTSELESFIDQSRTSVEKIINGEDSRLLLIVGPCSIHDEEATYEYAEKFSQLASRVSEKFFLVMRAYFEKPRTKKGWKGLIYDPHLDGSNDIKKGISLTRKILFNLTKMHVPVGCELLELTTSNYYCDFLTWGCIGARTCTSQPHRQLASSFSFPIGFKNSTDGNIDNALNGILAANASHAFLGVTLENKIDYVKTYGNPHCHLILRGGEQGPNYDSHSIKKALDKCDRVGIKQRVLVDCSHDNSQKKESRQAICFESVCQQINEGNQRICGMMIESHLFQGCQSIGMPLRYGVSVTDPCMDWHSTESMILQAADNVLLDKNVILPVCV